MEDISGTLITYGYIALFFYSLGGGFIALIAAAALSYAGKMDLWLAMGVAFVANFLGDMLLVYMARYNKSVIKPYLQKHRRKLAYSHLLMKKYGSSIIIFKKFIYGLKTLVPVAIGFTRYDFRKFAFLNLIAAAIWTLAFGFGGYYGAEIVAQIYTKFSDYPYLAPILALSILFGIWKLFERVEKKK